MFYRPDARCENGVINMKCESKICKGSRRQGQVIRS